MTWLIPLLVLLLAVPVSIVIRRERTQRRHALARALGLGYQEGGFGHSERMIGTRRGLAVSIQWISRNQGRQRRTYTRWIVGGASPSLTLRPQGIGNELLRRVSGGEDLIVGDPEFDREVIVSGPPALVSALLDHHARRKILALPDGAALGSGNLTWDTRGEPGEPEVVAYTLDHAVELMERLADPGPALVERLAGVAATDQIGRAHV